MMSHHCHATNCHLKVPPEMFMCRTHWFKLPKKLRDRIWKYYRLGQCDDWNISKEYSEAAKDSIIWIANLEGVKPDIKLYEILEPDDEAT